MAKFISDDDMLQLESVQPAPSQKKIITDDEMSQIEASQPSELASGLRGGLQGATMGFADEIAGGAEALWEAAKGDPRAFGELYKAKRDESREAFKQAEQANPKSYMAGQAAGAVGTGLATGGTSLPALAAAGAAQGLGSSEADLTEGEFGQAAQDVATGAGTGVVLGGASKALGSLASKAGDVASRGVSAGREILEDVATAPLSNPNAPMGAVSKALSKVSQAGSKVNTKLDELTEAVTPSVAEAPSWIKSLGRRGLSTMDPTGITPAVSTAADIAQYGPQAVQKAANLSLSIADKSKSIGQRLPDMVKNSPQRFGKYAKPLQDAVQRGGTSLAATHFILQQTEPEYRQMIQDEDGENEE